MMSPFSTGTLSVNLEGVKDGYVLTYNQEEGSFIAVSPSTFLALPASITNLTATTLSNTTVALSWEGTESAIAYEIRSDIGLSVKTRNTEYIVSDLLPGVSYVFTVSSTNQVGKSIATEISVVTLEKPEAVEDLQATFVDQTKIKILFAPSSRATSYDVLLNGEKVETVTDFYYEIEGVEPETSYLVTVRAINEAGVSSDATLTVQTLAVNNLAFRLDFTGRAGSKSNTVIDSVAGIACTLVNVAHTGTDGFLDNRGLTVPITGYVVAPLSSIAQKINLVSGATFEFVAYNPNGVLFKTDNNDLRAYVNHSNLISIKYNTSVYGDQIFHNYVPVSIGSSIAEPPPTRTISGIAINRKRDYLEVGQAFPIMATTLPFDVYNDNVVVWTSSNPTVCSVDFGVLKGESAGTALITAYDGTRRFSKSFTVTVAKPASVEILPQEIYHVTINDYGIKIDNTDAINTTHGIQAALDFASSAGYKEIDFPHGTYLITPEARTILPPRNLVINFLNSSLNIAPNKLSKTKYAMIKFVNVSHSKFINTHIYGEADSVVHVKDADESCVTVWFDVCSKCGFENCTLSKFPGFNITGHNSSGGDQSGRHPSKDNWEAGLLSDVTGLNDNSVLTNCFRSINYLNVSQLGSSYTLGYTQGYFGYPYLRSRLYSIYFYDNNYNFIVAHNHNLQYYSSDTPANAKYAKLVIYQEVKPSKHDNDFKAVAMLRTFHMPVECFLKNCTIEDNNSCGFAVTGGSDWIIEGNTFSRNGKRMPSCDIDWEDGWELSIGDICRGNTFNSPSGVIFSGCQSTALYDNTFNQSNLHVWGKSVNFRIFNNFFDGKGNNRNLTLEAGGESYFSRNILKSVSYSKSLAHAEASYRIRDDNNTLI